MLRLKQKPSIHFIKYSALLTMSLVRLQSLPKSISRHISPKLLLVPGWGKPVATLNTLLAAKQLGNSTVQCNDCFRSLVGFAFVMYHIYFHACSSLYNSCFTCTKRRTNPLTALGRSRSETGSSAATLGAPPQDKYY